MRRLQTIYTEPRGDLTLWGQAVMDLVAPHHDVTIYDHEQPLSQLADAEAVIDLGGENMRRPMFEAAKKLKFWQMLTIGYDFGRDLSFAKETGLPTSNCPGSTCAPGLAEAALMFILMLTKKYHEAHDLLKRGQLHEPFMGDLEDRILGLIGFGASGQALGRRARAFGMQVMIIEPLTIDQAALDAVQPIFVGKPDALDRVVSEADFISLHLPLTSETEGLIDARRIAMMKPTACMINVARGNLVDEAALHAALREGKIGGIGADVYSNYDVKPSQTLLGHPRFVALPHVAGCSPNSARGRANIALENLNRLAEGLEPKYQIF